jgi:hypothetical protein
MDRVEEWADAALKEVTKVRPLSFPRARALF